MSTYDITGKCVINIGGDDYVVSVKDAGAVFGILQNAPRVDRAYDARDNSHVVSRYQGEVTIRQIKGPILTREEYEVIVAEKDAERETARLAREAEAARKAEEEAALAQLSEPLAIDAGDAIG